MNTLPIVLLRQKNMDFHRKRTGFVIFGSFLVLIGVICNVWFLSKVFSPDGTLILPTRILIWTFDILCVCSGLFLIYRRNALALVQLSILLVSVVFCLMIADRYLASRIFANFYLH